MSIFPKVLPTVAKLMYNDRMCTTDEHIWRVCLQIFKCIGLPLHITLVPYLTSIIYHVIYYKYHWKEVWGKYFHSELRTPFVKHDHVIFFTYIELNICYIYWIKQRK